MGSTAHGCYGSLTNGPHQKSTRASHSEETNDDATTEMLDVWAATDGM